MDELIESIYSNPHHWAMTSYTFKHKDGLELWVANGVLCVSTYNTAIYISMVSKFRFWRAYKWWCKNAPLDVISRWKAL